MEDAAAQDCPSLPNAARVRDNQRRSRARRKEYVQELEAKVRHYEKHGVQAAKEIQDAARVVLEENRALKAELQELRRLRESDRNHTRSTVASSDFQTRAVNVAKEAVVPHKVHQDTSSFQVRVPTRNSTVTNHIISTSQSTSTLGIAHTIPRNNTLPSICHIIARPATEKQPKEIPPEASSQNRHNPTFIQSKKGGEQAHTWAEELDMSNDRSSCAFAVSVLTSMRADITAEDVQAELGCNSGFDRCRVDNSKLFTAVDRYT